MRIYATTDVGRERDHNEDAFVVCANLLDNASWGKKNIDTNFPSYDLGNYGTLLVVADGLGGVNSGEVASDLAVEGVKSFFVEKMGEISKDKQLEVRKVLEEAIHFCNNKIIAHGKSNPETQGMGTTIILGWVIKDIVYISWVGDSRAYLYRPSDTNKLSQISKDHSLVQELIDKGEITEEQAFYHPNKNITVSYTHLTLPTKRIV